MYDQGIQEFLGSHLFIGSLTVVCLLAIVIPLVRDGVHVINHNSDVEGGPHHCWHCRGTSHCRNCQATTPAGHHATTHEES